MQFRIPSRHAIKEAIVAMPPLFLRPSERPSTMASSSSSDPYTHVQFDTSIVRFILALKRAREISLRQS
jgi:DNA repair photolyase